MNMKNLALTVISALCFASTAIAQTLPLHEQPDAASKVVGAANLSAGIIPIYTPAQGDWIKVADPRNGNVGWIKSSDITNAKGGSNVTFTQRIITNGGGQGSYHVFQFGGGTAPMVEVTPAKPASPTNEKMNALMRKMQNERQTLQNSMQTIIKDMNEFFQYQIDILNEQLNPPPATAPMQKLKPANPKPAATNPASQSPQPK